MCFLYFRLAYLAHFSIQARLFLMLLLATVMLSSKFLSLLHEPPLQVKMHDFFMRDCQDWRYFSSFFGQWYCFDDKHWEAWNNRWISQWFFSSTNSSTFQKRPAQFSDLGVVVFLVAPHYFRQMESCLRALENNFFSHYFSFGQHHLQIPHVESYS
jgi:hypothetical protein